MKTIEEKARAYDEAIERAKIAFKKKGYYTAEDIDYIFPELKESEDEKAIRLLKKLVDNNEILSREATNSCYAWLEKQKSVEWSEEDEIMMKDILDMIDDEIAASDFHDMERWLKSLKEKLKR